VILIGSGALLERAIKFLIKNNYEIEHVLLQTTSSIEKKLLAHNISYTISNDINFDLKLFLYNRPSTIIFLLNCDTLIDNNLLLTHHSFFNIHNGLVQSYRGISEVCVFAAICNSEKEYGATLQILNAFELIDSGKIVAQRKFPMTSTIDYFSLFMESVKNCEYIFQENLNSILNNQYNTEEMHTLGELFSFKDLRVIIKGVDPKLLFKACSLGPLKFYLPKLVKEIRDIGINLDAEAL